MIHTWMSGNYMRPGKEPQERREETISKPHTRQSLCSHQKGWKPYICQGIGTEYSEDYCFSWPGKVSSRLNTGKFWKRWEYQTTWPASWETCMQVRKQQLELDIEQQTGSKKEKEYIKAVYCHPAYLTYMQSTSWEKHWAGRSISWNQDCREKYQSPQICRWHHP